MSTAATLVESLSPMVDGIRALHRTFGEYQYTLHRVKVRWNGIRRGEGEPTVIEDVEVLPTPKIMGVSELEKVMHSIGRSEQGILRIAEMSLRYTEDWIRGKDCGDKENVFFEVRQDSGVRRRFVVVGGEELKGSDIGWTFKLFEQSGQRTPDGRAR